MSRTPALRIRGTDASVEVVVRRLIDQALEAGRRDGRVTVCWELEGSEVELTVTGVSRPSVGGEPAAAVEPAAAGGVDEPAAFLLVEDHELSARALARWLRAHGSVVIAPTLKDARERYAERRRWLGLLLDVNLPDGSGLDFLEEVRRNDVRVPVLVLTGELDPARTNRAQSLDAEFAFKPFNDSNLRSFARRARARLHAQDRSVASVVAALTVEFSLTQREADVLAVVVRSDGSPRAAAADALGLSPNTAKVHIGSILKKTGYARLADLARRVLRDAWVATRPPAD